MNRAKDIHWSVLESRGLAMVSAYGLGHSWNLSTEKVASVAITDAELRQVTTIKAQEHPAPIMIVDD